MVADPEGRLDVEMGQTVSLRRQQVDIDLIFGVEDQGAGDHAVQRDRVGETAVPVDQYRAGGRIGEIQDEGELVFTHPQDKRICRDDPVPIQDGFYCWLLHLHVGGGA